MYLIISLSQFPKPLIFKTEISIQTFHISSYSGPIQLVCIDSICIWNPYVHIFPLHTMALRPGVSSPGKICSQRMVVVVECVAGK